MRTIDPVVYETLHEEDCMFWTPNKPYLIDPFEAESELESGIAEAPAAFFGPGRMSLDVKRIIGGTGCDCVREFGAAVTTKHGPPSGRPDLCFCVMAHAARAEG
jgi:hypothetical protein